MPFPKQNVQKVSVASLFKCKSQPSTFGHYANKEFHPSAPCQTCFPESNKQVQVLEDLGVQNLLCLSLEQNSIEMKCLQKTLADTLGSVQAHWAQLEYIAKLGCIKIFFAVQQTPIDKLLIQFCIGAMHESRLLVIDTNTSYEIGSFFEKNPKCNALILLGKENDALMTIFKLIEEFRENGLDGQARIVFISHAYEIFDSMDKLNQQDDLKPDARVNFSYSYFLSDFASLLEKKGAVDISSHLKNEIWKNTPVMMSHVVGFLCRYQKYSKETSVTQWTSGIQSVRNMLRLKFDVVGVGDLTEITRQSQRFLESSQVSSYFLSPLLDSVMHRAIMVKSMFACIDEIDCHSECHKLKKDAALENFKTLTRIFENSLSFIHPPCVETASIESKTFSYFIANGILSESSDEVITVESRIAKNISQYLDLASDDEDEELTDLQPNSALIYVDVQSLNAVKWMVSIVDEMLEIYLSVAKAIYEIRYVDVMETSAFLEKVTCQYIDLFVKQWNEHFDRVVDAALKLFQKEGIIGRYFHSSNVAIVYCILPFQEERLLQLILQMSQLL